MGFNWNEFYVQVSSAFFIVVLTGLSAVLWKLSNVLKELPEFMKETKEKLKAHEERHDVQDNLWSQHLNHIIRSEMIAEGKMDYPTKIWTKMKE